MPGRSRRASRPWGGLIGACCSATRRIPIKADWAFAVSGLPLGQSGEEILEALYGVSEEGRITCRSARAKGSVTTTPSVPYLDSLDAGAPVGGFVLDDPHFSVELPTLDLRVVKQTGHTHLLTGAVLGGGPRRSCSGSARETGASRLVRPRTGPASFAVARRPTAST